VLALTDGETDGEVGMRKWRKMTWVLWIWSALIVLRVVAGAGSSDCANEADKLSQDACHAGTGSA
jgi:hypothetical protein